MAIDADWLIPSLTLTFLAGAVRGYAGFGFSITLALGLLWVLPPLQVIAVVLLLDLLGALGLLKYAWQFADRQILARLPPPMLAFSLTGPLALASLPAGAAKLLIATLCLLGALASFCRPGTIALSRRRDLAMALPAGAVSGLAMSIASAGGPPLMLYLMHTTLDAARARATAILFFIAASATAVMGYALNGAVSLPTLTVSAALLPAALLGASVGQRCFQRYPPVSYRKTVSPLLVVMALWVLASELWTIFLSSSSF
ncbi:sulfite exporter TauE/SafE family protein [Vreelandella populi]|uniref:Probable membrane transporter protein n=1 Tax=Vreelandella populi TaxID=2498858 RepID=A0A433LBX7_9GAMM|nr:sulfite exporter TauE/SafE family protein [Halomonas populi]RUR39118.1 sulfite exporter TauE/SafE family protein [Halomonas populi]RUR46178.1 sulfite exporter TauE/SafE family protein [Halomonas populi]